MLQPGERHIFERGCLRAGEEWIEGNLVPVAAVTVGTMVLKVLLLTNTSALLFLFLTINMAMLFLKKLLMNTI